MYFFSFDNIDMKFAELEKLIEKSYNTIEVLPTTSRVEIINKRKFANVALDENFKTFIVYIAILKIISIYFSMTF